MIRDLKEIFVISEIEVWKPIISFKIPCAGFLNFFEIATVLLVYNSRVSIVVGLLSFLLLSTAYIEN